MKVAVLPLNASEGTRPALGRQFSNFVSDAIRAAVATADLQSVNFLTQVKESDGPRAAYVNVADQLLEKKWIDQMFEQSDVDAVWDGMISKRGDDTFEVVVRAHKRGQDDPILDEHFEFRPDEVFAVLGKLVQRLASVAEVQLPEPMASGQVDFGTSKGEAFLKFLEGYDAMLYIQQTQGRVAKEFDPRPAMDLLLEANALDPDFLGPYETLVQLCRLCAQHQIGTFESVESSLNKLIESAPEDWRGHFALGEVYQSVHDAQRAADAYEKAILNNPGEAALYTRLGLAQMVMGMPVNAERNFRRAVELEPDEKPSLDHVAMVLQATGREHEIPQLWKEQIERMPQDAQAHAKYAISLLQIGREDEGIRAFDEAMEKLEDPTLIKRYYAPVLAQKGELDRAMDYYEDCLDVAPTDVALLLEYANTLKAANREFEVPKVLRDVLACNPDPDIRAQTLAWLIELEQPRRAELVEAAKSKVDEGDYDGAVTTLKPLRNWLADYWKLWLLLAIAHNKLGQHEDAEDAAKRLVDIYPGCEPAYTELTGALTGLGKTEEAYNFLRYAATKMPQSLAVHVNLALAANRSGHQDEAKQLARQIREALGQNEEIERVLAEIGA